MPLSSHSERLMGTTITIALVDERADSLIQKSFDLLRELEYRFNANSQESELMEINHQSWNSPRQGSSRPVRTDFTWIRA